MLNAKQLKHLVKIGNRLWFKGLFKPIVCLLGAFSPWFNFLLFTESANWSDVSGAGAKT